MQQLCAYTGCSLKDLLEVMDDREGWCERVRVIHTVGMTWWWWWTTKYLMTYLCSSQEVFIWFAAILNCHKTNILARITWFLLWTNVIYWPSTEPSIKRCTCVNKRKNSGSRWTLENNITRCLGGLSHLETGCWSEYQLQTDGFGLLVTLSWATQAKMQKKCCYGREKNLGSI